MYDALCIIYEIISSKRLSTQTNYKNKLVRALDWIGCPCLQTLLL